MSEQLILPSKAGDKPTLDCERHHVAWRTMIRSEDALVIQVRICHEADKAVAFQSWNIDRSVHRRSN